MALSNDSRAPRTSADLPEVVEFPQELEGSAVDTRRTHSRRQKKESDPIEELFLSSRQPAIALFAISICLVGVMDFLPRHRYDPEIWHDKLESVSGFYGPGVVWSWCLGSMSMLYDANDVFKTNPDGFHYLKYAALWFTGIAATLDALWRAVHVDFGPSYAAALYLSDKAFEVAVLLYTIRLFPITRASAKAHLDVPMAERPVTSFGAQAAAAIDRYKIYPFIPLVSIWVWCRALGNGHAVYNIHAQNPLGVYTGWNPVLKWYIKPFVPFLCLMATATITSVTGWGFWNWGLPTSILASFAMLHSGLFGTSTPLKLTTCQITDMDQMTALLMTALFLFVQYMRKVPLVQRTCTELREWVLKSPPTSPT